MAQVSFNILDGSDAGKAYCDLATPVTIGREEGNSLRLNDERVSRFHLKVQEDQGHVVLTDLESTNGTRVNGENVRVSLLRPGDQIRIGGTLLVFGSPEEILARIERVAQETGAVLPEADFGGDAGGDALVDTPQPSDAEATGERATSPQGDGCDAPKSPSPIDTSASKTLLPLKDVQAHLGRGPLTNDQLWRQPPALPTHLSPAQAAQLSELLATLHRRLRAVIDSVSIDRPDGSIRASLPSWQWVLSLQMDLARLIRDIAEPEFDDL